MAGFFRNLGGTTQLQNMADSRVIFSVDDNGLMYETALDAIAAAGQWHAVLSA